MVWRLDFFAAVFKMIRKSIWTIIKKWLMQLRNRIFNDLFISIIIQAGIILVLMIIKNLLNILLHWQKKPESLFVMKRIVQEFYMLLLLQDNSWKNTPN